MYVLHLSPLPLHNLTQPPEPPHIGRDTFLPNLSAYRLARVCVYYLGMYALHVGGYADKPRGYGYLSLA